MPETPKFVVNDRRKFTSEGELRHDAVSPDASPALSPEPAGDTQFTAPTTVGSEPTASTTEEFADLPETSAFDVSTDLVADGGEGSQYAAQGSEDALADGDRDDFELPAGPTAEQSAEVGRAYNATTDRLDTALRAADPGGERIPEMTFERLTQSLYTQALLLLGGGAQPGETPRVDILGARQTIDMIGIIAEKTKGNLSPDEDKLLQSALFDLRMGFLEITQALARQAQQRGAGAGGPGGLGGPGGPGSFGGVNPGAGPRIVR